MRRIQLFSAAAVALMLAVAVTAYAVPASQTTFKLDTSASPKKAGTSKKPKAMKLKIKMIGDTKPPGGSPATSTDVKIQLPSTIKWMGAKWPKSKQCDPSAADSAKSDSVCPKGSRISLKKPSFKVNHVHATAQPDPTKGKIEEDIDLTAYVLKKDSSHNPASKAGDLGLWLQSTPTALVPISVMLVGKITKHGTLISVHIPDNVQEPVKGIPTGIEELNFQLDGKVKVHRKTYGALSSVGCKKGKWKTVVTNIYRDGKKKDSDTAKCTAAKKKKKK